MIKRNTVETSVENRQTCPDPFGEGRLGSVLTTANQRLDDLYEKCMENDDTKTAFQVQKEIHRLLQFRERVTSDGDQEGTASAGHASADLAKAEATLSLIGRHLLPLGLADESYPIQEHARLAAAVMRERQCLPDAVLGE